jgi:hypothetical protein
LFLTENILALDTRNKVEFKANELEWRPKEKRLDK